MLKGTVFATAVAVTTLSAASHAAVIAGWDFANGSYPGGLNNFGPSPAAPSTIATNVTIGGLARGPGLATAGGTGSPNAWGAIDWDGPSSAGAATSDGNYVTFTIKANDGFQLSLSGISAYNVRRSALGPTHGAWQYSIDGTNFSNIGSDIAWGGSGTSGNAQAAIDLSGIAALQNVSETMTVTFRIASYNATSAGGQWNLNHFQTGDDFVINGAVTHAPEPAVLGLLTFASLVLLSRRRA